MDAFDVVREETDRMKRRFIPLMLLSYAAFALTGHYDWGTALSLLLGTAYALFNFYQMACTSVRAALIGDEARARRIQSSRYAVRYMLTAGLMVAAVKIAVLNPVAVIIPLFFPKIILTASGILQRKGG